MIYNLDDAFKYSPTLNDTPNYYVQQQQPQEEQLSKCSIIMSHCQECKECNDKLMNFVNKKHSPNDTIVIILLVIILLILLFKH